MGFNGPKRTHYVKCGLTIGCCPFSLQLGCPLRATDASGRVPGRKSPWTLWPFSVSSVFSHCLRTARFNNLLTAAPTSRPIPQRRHIRDRLRERPIAAREILGDILVFAILMIGGRLNDPRPTLPRAFAVAINVVDAHHHGIAEFAGLRSLDRWLLDQNDSAIAHIELRTMVPDSEVQQSRRCCTASRSPRPNSDRRARESQWRAASTDWLASPSNLARHGS